MNPLRFNRILFCLLLFLVAEGSMAQTPKAYNKRCPLSGNPVNPSIATFTYRKKVYGMCCDVCRGKVVKNPYHYLVKRKQKTRPKVTQTRPWLLRSTGGTGQNQRMVRPGSTLKWVQEESGFYRAVILPTEDGLHSNAVDIGDTIYPQLPR